VHSNTETVHLLRWVLQETFSPHRMEALGLQGLLEHNTNSTELPTENNPPSSPVSNSH